MLRALLLLAIAAPAPALAGSIADTHREVAMPAGKTVKLYRPINGRDCAVAARHHQAGKMPLMPAAPPSEACAALAARKAARAAQVAER